jgi:hypothetical protein
MKKIAIIGCGRSGTKYASVVLQTMGLKVPHEKLGKDGASSWYITPTNFETPCFVPFKGVSFFSFSKHDGRTFIDYPEYLVILHQVRSPLPVISSFMNVATEPSWNFILNHVPEINGGNMIEKCMKYWFLWNKIAETKAEWTYKVEDLTTPEIFKEFCERIGRPPLFSSLDKVKEVSGKTNTRRHKKEYNDLTWRELYETSKHLCLDIINLAKHYGYDISLDFL